MFQAAVRKDHTRISYMRVWMKIISRLSSNSDVRLYVCFLTFGQETSAIMDDWAVFPPRNVGPRKVMGFSRAAVLWGHG